MTDRITKEQRSKNVSAVRGYGNKSTELFTAKLFRKAGITGWRRKQKIFGIRPDFVFKRKKIAVFVHGCFWHGCRKYRTIPETNSEFWLKKIEGNRRRDQFSELKLKKEGWTIIKIWEHDLKNPTTALKFGNIAGYQIFSKKAAILD
jgi:DNA mismatch endonuclease (patch repair protein)